MLLTQECILESIDMFFSFQRATETYFIYGCQRSLQLLPLSGITVFLRLTG